MDNQNYYENLHQESRQTAAYVEEKEREHKLKIVTDCLPRYTGMPLAEFSKYILLTNFYNYIEIFANTYNGKIYGHGKMMQACTANGITIINIGMGSPNASLIMDLLISVNPNAVLFLGKCGGIRSTQLGDFIIPIGGIRGTSVCYEYNIPENSPCFPYLEINRYVADVLDNKGMTYKTGTIFTTARRIWEHNESFKDKLVESRATAIDMETATLFTVGYHNKIPNAALLLVSDLPMTPEGVKTEKSDLHITQNFVNLHISSGVDIMQKIINDGGIKKHNIF